MRVIYEPKGRAREYAALACNLFTGCPHGCRYCYAPAVLHRTREDFQNVTLRKGVLGHLWRDVGELVDAGCTDEILLCFACDPYPTGYDSLATRTALDIIGGDGLKATVLTKAPSLARRDFNVLAAYGFRLGVSCGFMSEGLRTEWEPGAESIWNRYTALADAKEAGISTWVSMEPVVCPESALNFIEHAHCVVDHWKVGKLNYGGELERSIDWPQFRRDVTALLDRVGADYYIKQDLREA